MTLTASLIAISPWQGADINIVISLLIIQTECACRLESITGLASIVITTEHRVHPFFTWPVKGCLIRYSVRSRCENFTSLRFVIVSVYLKPATLLRSLVMRSCKSLTPLNTAQATMS